MPAGRVGSQPAGANQFPAFPATLQVTENFQSGAIAQGAQPLKMVRETFSLGRLTTSPDGFLADRKQATYCDSHMENDQLCSAYYRISDRSARHTSRYGVGQQVRSHALDFDPRHHHSFKHNLVEPHSRRSHHDRSAQFSRAINCQFFGYQPPSSDGKRL